MAFIKNIEHETVLPLAEQVNCTAGTDRQPYTGSEQGSQRNFICL